MPNGTRMMNSFIPVTSSGLNLAFSIKLAEKSLSKVQYSFQNMPNTYLKFGQFAEQEITLTCLRSAPKYLNTLLHFKFKEETMVARGVNKILKGLIKM